MTQKTAANAALKIDANSQPARQLLDDIRQARLPTPRQTESTKPASTPPADSPDVKQDLERGLIFLNNRQYNQAAAAFKRVIKVDADSIEAYCGLGQAYLEVGAFDDAKDAADEVLTRNPNHRQARELLQIIRFARNMERNRKIRKKVLFYAGIFGIIAATIFVIYSIWSPQPEPVNTKHPKPSQASSKAIKPDPSIEVTALLEEPSVSRNGVLEAGENARLMLVISNKGGTARNVELRIQPFEPPSTAGLRFTNAKLIPELSEKKIETIRIPITADKKIQGRDQVLQIQLFGKDRTLLTTKNFSFKITPATPASERPGRR